MTSYYLKFADEAEANAVLITTVDEISDEEGIVVPASVTPNYANIDIIGVIYKPTGEMLMGEDGEYPAMAALDGWHVNVLVVDEDASALEPYAVTPAVPVRVWG
jgi:hypothetical protein